MRYAALFWLAVLVAAPGGTPIENPDIGLPPDVLEHLSLQSGELPLDYKLIDDKDFLAHLGMTTNPDFIGNRTEMESIATRGGLISFLAAYGPAAKPRLMVNGVYFRNVERLEAFVEFQREKKKNVLTLRKAFDDGEWLLMLARDPEARYSDDEHEQIDEGIKRYQRRLGTVTVFDDFWSKPDS